LLVFSYRNNLSTGTGQHRRRRLVGLASSKERAVFIALIVVIILIAAYLGLHLRRQQRR
jgi:hypothetical protein